MDTNHIELHVDSGEIKWKTKNITLLEHFQIPTEISTKEAKSIPLAHKYMTAQLYLDWFNNLNKEWRGLD